MEEVDEEIEPLTTSSENILKVDPSDFVYDEVTDTIKPVDVKAFEVLVENHPSVHKLKRGDKRDDKIAGLKTKVLDTLKVKERRNRDLSCDSIKSDCSGWSMSSNRDKSTDSRGSVRCGSEEDLTLHAAKKPHKSRSPTIKPPTILVSKK